VIRDARFRADQIPSFEASWSDAAGSTVIDFDTNAAAGPFAFLGGIQVGASTEVEFTNQFPAASPGADHYLTFRDLGEDGGQPLQKMFTAGAFGIDNFNYTSTEGGGARNLSASYTADENHRLVADLETALGGRFFPDYAIDATAVIDAVPQAWSFSTDLATSLVSNSSAEEIDSITVQGDITREVDDGMGGTTEEDHHCRCRHPWAADTGELRARPDHRG